MSKLTHFNINTMIYDYIVDSQAKFDALVARGCYSVNSSTISNVYACTSTGNGAGCHTCNSSIISNISACASNGTGGGCYGCLNVTLSGQFDNEGTVDNIASCTYIGQFGYTNNAGTITYLHTTALTTTDLH